MVEFGDGGALNKDLSLLYPSSKSRCANTRCTICIFFVASSKCATDGSMPADEGNCVNPVIREVEKLILTLSQLYLLLNRLIKIEI